MSRVYETLSSADLMKISKVHGNAFYLLDSEQFRQNFIELRQAFASFYPRTNIAYSYKTNYIPKLCRIVDELGGYSEVVSDMEMEIALHCGVNPERIIWNGPIKNPSKVEWLLLEGGTINADSIDEVNMIVNIAHKHPGNKLNVGVRCNFDVNDGVLSRFGIDVHDMDFKKAVDAILNTANIHLINLQCHFAKRQVKYWPARVEGMLKVVDDIGYIPDRIDLGGGIFGKMDESLKIQFTAIIPEYAAYAEEAAKVFAERFSREEKQPELLIEPGSALVGDCMRFVGRVNNIKTVRGKSIATVLGSQKNISMTGVNPPMRVFAAGQQQKEYCDLDFAGFTCIESDYLYKHYNGPLAVGDFIVISNCGSYSLVMKPPFILPNFPVLDLCVEGGVDCLEVIKRGEVFEDLFHTFTF